MWKLFFYTYNASCAHYSILAFNNYLFFLAAIPYPGVALWADQHADRRLYYCEWASIITLHHSASKDKMFRFVRIISPFLEGPTSWCLIPTVLLAQSISAERFTWNSHALICKWTWFACHRSLIEFDSLTVLFAEGIILITACTSLKVKWKDRCRVWVFSAWIFLVCMPAFSARVTEQSLK